MPYDDDPHHPVIDQPWTYEILLLCYHAVPEDWRESYLDLTLRRGGTVRRLRFLAPQDFYVQEGCFPQPTGGMCILDVRHRQLGDIGVMVDDREGTRGGVRLWARAVIDLDTGSACGKEPSADTDPPRPDEP